MLEKQIYIITGGPGFGKTELIEALGVEGFLVSGEFARDLILSETESGGEILPWKNSRLFQETILTKRKAFFESVPMDAIAFADRAIPDQLAFIRYRGFGTPDSLLNAALEYRYATTVFVTPPWPEIYKNDRIRTETLAEAIQIHQFVIETYRDLNYRINELPLVPTAERVQYLLKNL